MTVEQIAKKHGVSPKEIEVQLATGVEIEKEHYPDLPHRNKIALDHLAEIPDYYTRLVKMEKEAKAKDCDDEDDERSDKAFKTLKGEDED